MIEGIEWLKMKEIRICIVYNNLILSDFSREEKCKKNSRWNSYTNFYGNKDKFKESGNEIAGHETEESRK